MICARKCLRLYFLSWAMSVSMGVAEEKQIEDLMSLSLDELLKVQTIAPATIIKGKSSEAPAAFTTISKRDIQTSPARNLLDLIEIYVPGAIWLNYEQGPLIGMRGHIVSRNYKYLLLLNGRVLNDKAMRGAQSELELWQLSDIEYIEVIRSPGSVTYGPGAVAGVIHIHTTRPSAKKNISVEGHYVSKYDSKGLGLNISSHNKYMKLYSHLSFSRTEGYEASHFVGDDGAGFIGEDILLNDRPLDYFGDYQNTPQIKFHSEMHLNNDWKSWFRYTQQGSNWAGNEVKTDFGDGVLVNSQSVQMRQLTFALEKDYKISKDKMVSVLLSLNSTDSESRSDRDVNSEPNHVQNKRSDYAENEFLFKSTYQFSPNSKSDLAFGFEYAYDEYGPGWNDDPHNMRLGGDGQIVSDTSSLALGPKLDIKDAVFVGDGWHTHSYALFGEAKYKFSDQLNLLLSGRYDKSSYSDHIFSPRLSLLKKFDGHNLLRLITQRSTRRNTASNEYIEYVRNGEASKENLDSIELIYTKQITSESFLNIGTFYNDAEVIAWDSDRELTQDVGDLNVFGFELEYDRRSELIHWGVNYSYTKQMDFDLDQSLSSSGISYSDYNESIGSEGAMIMGHGNDLNNWPNQAFKLFMTRPISSKISLHLNSQFFWDYQGGKDGLTALTQAVVGTSDESSVRDEVNRVNSEDTYSLNFRTNFLLSYALQRNSRIEFGVVNVFGDKFNKRYSYDNGISKPKPHKVRFFEEERAFSLKYTHSW